MRILAVIEALLGCSKATARIPQKTLELEGYVTDAREKENYRVTNYWKLMIFEYHLKHAWMHSIVWSHRAR